MKKKKHSKIWITFKKQKNIYLQRLYTDRHRPSSWRWIVTTYMNWLNFSWKWMVQQQEAEKQRWNSFMSKLIPPHELMFIETARGDDAVELEVLSNYILDQRKWCSRIIILSWYPKMFVSQSYISFLACSSLFSSLSFL